MQKQRRYPMAVTKNFFKRNENGRVYYGTSKNFLEDEKTGSTYFICNNEFYSAPTYTDHSIMKDECMLVSEWENMEDFWESSTNFTHVIRILEKLMERELSKLPDKNHEW